MPGDVASTRLVASRPPPLTMTSSARTFSGASTGRAPRRKSRQPVRLIEGRHDHRHIDPVRTELHRNTFTEAEVIEGHHDHLGAELGHQKVVDQREQPHQHQRCRSSPPETVEQRLARGTWPPFVAERKYLLPEKPATAPAVPRRQLGERRRHREDLASTKTRTCRAPAARRRSGVAGDPGPPPVTQQRRRPGHEGSAQMTSAPDVGEKLVSLAHHGLDSTDRPFAGQALRRGWADR